MKKIIKTIAVLALVLSLTAVACTADTAPARPVRVAALKGPTGMAVAHMMKQNEGAYEFLIESQPANVNALIVHDPSVRLELTRCAWNRKAAVCLRANGHGLPCLNQGTDGWDEIRPSVITAGLPCQTGADQDHGIPSFAVFRSYFSTNNGAMQAEARHILTRSLRACNLSGFMI